MSVVLLILSAFFFVTVGVVYSNYRRLFAPPVTPEDFAFVPTMEDMQAPHLGAAWSVLAIVCAFVMPVIALAHAISLHWVWLFFINIIVMYLLKVGVLFGTFFFSFFSGATKYIKAMLVALFIAVVTLIIGLSLAP